jgi:hypothetical protein
MDERAAGQRGRQGGVGQKDGVGISQME